MLFVHLLIVIKYMRCVRLINSNDRKQKYKKKEGKGIAKLLMSRSRSFHKSLLKNPVLLWGPIHIDSGPCAP